MSDDRVRFFRGRARAFFENFILEPARGRFHAILLLVFLEKFLAFCLVLRRCFPGGGDLFFHHFFLPFLERLIAFVLRYGRFLTGESFLKANGEGIDVQVDLLLLETLTIFITGAVTGFIFLIFERRFILR